MKAKVFAVLSLAFLSGSLIAGGGTDRRDNDREEHQFHRPWLGTMVMTQNGFVLGAEENKDGYETWSWKGIPFAQPPERWKAPQPPEYWDFLNADTFGSKCPQYDGFGNFSGSEDCLYLNVWRPRTREHDLPVYFWIHGGGNSIGTGSDPMYHGNKLAPRGNMVVVTTNYRLGPLGWFVLPESLQDEDPPDDSCNHGSWKHQGKIRHARDRNHLDDSGNYGTLDIIQALRWVRANIAAFGGNPNNITIAGESAGGFNASTLLISPLAKDLFHKAISESGGFYLDTVSMAVGRASAQAAIDRMLTKDGCPDPDNPSCYDGDLNAYLMSKTPEEIFRVYPYMAGSGMLDFSVFLDRFTDGTVISALGKDALKNPKTYNQVPTILGNNKEELKLFNYYLYFGGMDPGVYQNYMLTLSMQWQQTGVNDLAAAMTANKGQPGVYAYEFDYGAYNEGGYNAWPPPYDIAFGAWHTLEIPFIFGDIFGPYSYYGLGPLIFRPDNQAGWEALSDSMVNYWSSFARTGRPYDPGGVRWRPWSNKNGGPKRILLDANADQTLIQMSDQ